MDGCRYLWTYPQSHLTACVDCNVAHSLLHHTSTGDWLENGNSIDTEEPLTNVRGFHERPSPVNRNVSITRCFFHFDQYLARFIVIPGHTPTLGLVQRSSAGAYFSGHCAPFRHAILALTRAEDKATQGCDLSADSGARPSRGGPTPAPLALLLSLGMA